MHSNELSPQKQVNFGVIMKRKWGQHFLVRERYVQRMIELAGVRAGDQVLEIGPGRGVLTRACLLYTSPSPRDGLLSRMPSSA